MADESLDIRVNNGVWSRFWSFFAGGRLVSNDSGSQMSGVSAYGEVGGSSINDLRITQISTVYACIRLITTMLGGLPFDCYKTQANGDRVKDNTTSLAKIMDAPNKFMNGLEFREAMNMNLAAYGNAYALVQRNRQGDVILLMPLQAARMQVSLSEDGKSIQYIYTRDKEVAYFTQAEIFHIKGFGYNGLVGMSPLSFAAQAAGVAIAMEDNQRDFYNNGAKSPQILMPSEGRTINREQRAQLAENFKEIAGGPNKRRLWVLEAGFQTQAIGINPNDAEMLASRKFQVAELARFFGVPPFMVGETEKSTSWGTGLEQQNLAFVQQTMKPYLDRWEAAVRSQLIPKADQGTLHMEFNLNGLLRGDSAARSAFYVAMKGAGIMTINEVRRLENLPPIPGGDVAMQQAQNVPITETGDSDANQTSQ